MSFSVDVQGTAFKNQMQPNTIAPLTAIRKNNGCKTYRRQPTGKVFLLYVFDLGNFSLCKVNTPVPT